jgi:ABC-type bacteriocin/lantibiotic exporter with double-glycine peptidase domain
MILAHYGNLVGEDNLEARVSKQPGGVHIEELVRLASHFGLRAEIVTVNWEEIGRLLEAKIYPIVYLNRYHFERKSPVSRKTALSSCIIHSVIPVHITAQFITFNDPRLGKRQRASKRKFEAAQSDLGHCCVVCRPR